ncbi:PREDICTED: zinc finger C2HC domain-containing protein 1A [Chrysochloris asiatica]|uniref:Zinc finger C2HC domain-containing protein 1A n=1 Tax=Chrysochloris asiatica TaxID=185453 RepID=A0A9B0T099_CHRAS|nr:PREDICTED: zinc finger C2HC domain-containing protein 1A [Chrysochloris asiatica]
MGGDPSTQGFSSTSQVHLDGNFTPSFWGSPILLIQLSGKPTTSAPAGPVHLSLGHGNPGPSENGRTQLGELLPCKICGRTFFPVALKKHGPICQKTATKKRKTFDSSRQRAEGTDIPTVKPLKPRPEPPKKPSNWRRKHEEFIATIRAAKGLDQVLKEGGKLPPPPPPSYDPDYIQCPYCQRRFNENAADRHINFCKEQAARISNKGKYSAEAKGKPTPRAQLLLTAENLAENEKLLLESMEKRDGEQQQGQVYSSQTWERLAEHGRKHPPIQAEGMPSGKVSSVSSSLGNKLQTLSPSHKGITAPQVGPSIKSRNSTPPSLARNPASGVPTSKRKIYTESYISRPDGDYLSSLNGGNIKSSEGNSSGHLPKFCHECGTKYPVEWAKFCCECGIRRMVL